MRTIARRQLNVIIPMLLVGAATVAVVQSPLMPSHAANSRHMIVPLRPQSQVPRGAALGTPAALGTITAPTPYAGPVLPTEGVAAIIITPPQVAAGPSTAAFTESAVRQYVMDHQFRTTDGTTPTIAKVLFIPASEASSLMGGESIGRPDTTLVCYVEVHGNLSRAGIVHEISPASTNTQPAQVGRLVFDAQTGNLLILGLQ